MTKNPACLLFLAAFLTISSSLYGQWTKLNPTTQLETYQLTVDGNQIWAGCLGGFFHSDDYGVHWQTLSVGSTYTVLRNGTDWYAVRGEQNCGNDYCIQRSGDGGQTWTTLGAVDIQYPLRPKIALLNGRLYVMHTTGYTDKLSVYDPVANTLKLIWEYGGSDQTKRAWDLEATANSIFLATDWGLIRFRNDGTEIDTVFNRRCRNVAVQGTTVYAFFRSTSNGYDELHFSADDGGLWDKLGLWANDDWFDLKFSGGRAWLFQYNNDKVLELSANYQSASPAFTGNFSDIAVFPDQTILLTGIGGMITRKPNELNFFNSNSGLRNYLYGEGILDVDDDLLVIGGEISTDTGVTWTTTVGKHYYHLSGVPDSFPYTGPVHRYTKKGAYYYARDEYVGIFRSTDLRKWTLLTDDFFLGSPKKIGDTLISWYGSSTPSLSQDGIQWQKSPYELPGPTNGSFNDVTFNDPLLHYFYEGPPGKKHFFTSPDKGAHWYAPVAGFPADAAFDQFVTLSADGADLVLRVLIDVPNSSQDLHQHYISHDFGYSWKKMSDPPASPVYFYNNPVAVRNKRVFLSDYESGNLWVSVNDGETWAEVDRDSISGNVQDIDFMGDLMFVSTPDGQWRRSLSGIQVRQYTGTVYFDKNNNQVQDPGEPGIPNMVMQVSGRNIYASTDSLGHYEINAEIIGDSLRPVMPRDFWTPAPGFATPKPGQEINDFAVYIAPNTREVEISAAAATVFRQGFNSEASIFLTNYGSVPSGPFQVRLSRHPKSYPAQFVSADPAPAFGKADSAVWEVPGLPLFGSIAIDARFYCQVDPLLGGFNTRLLLDAPVPDDALPQNNHFELREPMFGSFDPNDKIVMPENIHKTELPGANCRYVIRFQNTGNYKADFVVIRDTLPPDLDAASLQVTGASHTFTWKLHDRQVLEVRFDDINLPDSTSNEPESHGFVAFTVKADSTLQAGDTIRNRAAIYFDYNPPVITNYADVQIDNLSDVSAPAGKQRMEIELSPNPVAGGAGVAVSWPADTGGSVRISVFDLQGRLVQRVEAPEKQTRIVLNRLAAGAYVVQAGNGKFAGSKVLVVE